MALFPVIDEDAQYFSMFSEDIEWSRKSHKPFELDGFEWKTVEHYFQATKFADESYQETIRLTESHDEVLKLGKSWFKRKHKDWKKNQVTYMTRALYTQFQIYPEMAQALLETGDQKLVEDSAYDHFWGYGRDNRGDNHYGKILMNIREKLSQK